MKSYKLPTTGIVCLATCLMCISAKWQGVDGMRVSHAAPKTGAAEDSVGLPAETSMGEALRRLCPAAFKEKCKQKRSRYCGVEDDDLVVRWGQVAEGSEGLGSHIYMCVEKSTIVMEGGKSTMSAFDDCGNLLRLDGHIGSGTRYVVIDENVIRLEVDTILMKTCPPGQRALDEYCRKSKQGRIARYDTQVSSGRKALTCIYASDMSYDRIGACIDRCLGAVPCRGARAQQLPEGRLSYEDWMTTAELLHVLGKVSYPCKEEGKRKCVALHDTAQCEERTAANRLPEEFRLSDELGISPPVIVDVSGPTEEGAMDDGPALPQADAESGVDETGPYSDRQNSSGTQSVSSGEPAVERSQLSRMMRRSSGSNEFQEQEDQVGFLDDLMADDRTGVGALDELTKDDSEGLGAGDDLTFDDSAGRDTLDDLTFNDSVGVGSLDDLTLDSEGVAPSEEAQGESQEDNATPEPSPPAVPPPTFTPESPITKALEKNSGSAAAAENPTQHGGIAASVGDCQAFRVTPDGSVEFYQPGKPEDKIAIPLREKNPKNVQISVVRGGTGMLVTVRFTGGDGTTHDVGFNLNKDTCKETAQLSLGFANGVTA